ncbi:MAG: phytanoyl-CoA dioxygenase family protein [Sphingopyxis sp.]|nr:phytanoyl-CoA dioxygenase family protein [Sphingopyxis sp.]
MDRDARGGRGRPERAAATAMTDRITPEVVRKFETDGAVWLPGLLTRPWLDLIEAGMRRNINSPGPNSRRHYPGEPGTFYDDHCNYAAIPEFQRLLEDSPLADVMAKILQTANLWLFFEQIFVKEGGHSRRTPWHQDTPYFMADGRQIGSMWISLDPLASEETLEVVAGSHLGPLYNGTAFDPDDDTAPVFDPRKFPRLPDIEREREKWNIVSRASEPGDVLVMHPSILHGGAEIREGHRRRTLSIRMFGDDVVYVERPGAGHSPAFPGVSEALNPGDPLRHPWFPRLLPRT